MTDTNGASALIQRLQSLIYDPMWADHAEISKATLRAVVAALASPPSPAEGEDSPDWQLMTALAELDGVDSDDKNGCLKAARACITKARAALSQRQAQEQHKGHWCSLDHGGVFCRQCDLNVIAQEQAAPAMPVEAHVKPKWTVERNGNAYYPCNGNAYYPLRILEGRREVAAFHSWNDHKESDAALIVAAVNAYRTAPAEAPAVPVGWTLTFSDERDFCLAASPLIGAAYVVGLQAVERINTSPWGRKTFGKVLATPPSPAEASPGGEPGPVIKYGPLYEYAEGRGLDYNELCKLVRAVAAHPTKLVPLTKWEVMSALSLCPTDLPHPRRCEWLAEALNRKLAEKSGIALADVRETRNAN